MSVDEPNTVRTLRLAGPEDAKLAVPGEPQARSLGSRRYAAAATALTMRAVGLELTSASPTGEEYRAEAIKTGVIGDDDKTVELARRQLMERAKAVKDLKPPLFIHPDQWYELVDAQVDLLVAARQVEECELAETDEDRRIDLARSAEPVLRDGAQAIWLVHLRPAIVDTLRRALVAQASVLFRTSTRAAWPERDLKSIATKLANLESPDAQAAGQLWAIISQAGPSKIKTERRAAEAWGATRPNSVSLIKALNAWQEIDPTVELPDVSWQQQLDLFASDHTKRFPDNETIRTVTELDRAREDARYEGFFLESMTETVHNLGHLAHTVLWSPPSSGSEYDGCRAKDFAALSFRQTERLLTSPYFERLERDAPGAGAHFDHAIRNADYIKLVADLENPNVAKALAYMTEHLLRALVCIRDRSSATSPTGKTAAAIVESVLAEAGLSDHLPHLPAEIPDKHGDVELKDRVRLVKLAAGDKRKFKTTIACFTPRGKDTDLWKAIKRMPDPPRRPAAPIPW